MGTVVDGVHAAEQGPLAMVDDRAYHGHHRMAQRELASAVLLHQLIDELADAGFSHHRHRKDAARRNDLAGASHPAKPHICPRPTFRTADFRFIKAL